MPDIEKVKQGLRCCQVDKYGDLENCDICPYNRVSICVQDCRTALNKDVLKILREMEK